MGLARIEEVAGADAESRITQEGLVIGTPDYLAPEQARNARSADIRADIYSLGCTFFFLLKGESPYKGSTPTEKLLRHTTEPIPPLSRADVPPTVEGVLRKMMAKRPEDRFQTPVEIAFALQPFCGVSAQNGGGGLHGSPTQPYAPPNCCVPGCVPGGHWPESGITYQGGAAPPQHGFTQY